MDQCVIDEIISSQTEILNYDSYYVKRVIDFFKLKPRDLDATPEDFCQFYDVCEFLTKKFIPSLQFRGKMFSGKLKPNTAFKTGNLKLSGDMGKAMKLKKLMGKMQTKSFHTMPNHQRAYDQMFKRQKLSNGFHTSVSMSNEYKAMSEVLDRIKGVALEAIVKKNGAVYLFDVIDNGRYYMMKATREAAEANRNKQG